MRMFIVCSNRFGPDQKCDVKIQTEYETRFEMTNGLIWHAVALGNGVSGGRCSNEHNRRGVSSEHGIQIHSSGAPCASIRNQ